MLLLLLLLLFPFSVLVSNPKKLLHTVTNPARGLLNTGKIVKEKSGSASVEMVPNQVMGEMVLDGGGQFIPARIFGLHA